MSYHNKYLEKKFINTILRFVLLSYEYFSVHYTTPKHNVWKHKCLGCLFFFLSFGCLLNRNMNQFVFLCQCSRVDWLDSLGLSRCYLLVVFTCLFAQSEQKICLLHTFLLTKKTKAKSNYMATVFLSLIFTSMR